MKNLSLWLLIAYAQFAGAGPQPDCPQLNCPQPNCPQPDWMQPNWTYVTGRAGIRVYHRPVEGSRIKALKAECEIAASVSEVVALIMDVGAAGKWVCHTKSCTLIRKISATELYYYTEVSLSWPLDNRDFVTHLKVSEDLVTKIVTIQAPAIPGHLPVRKGIVRVSKSQSTWIIAPAGAQTTRVVYTLQVDPGGAIPAHIVNIFACQGPVETFLGMKKELKARQQIEK